MFDNIIMKPYFIYKFSHGNKNKEYEEFMKMEQFLWDKHQEELKWDEMEMVNYSQWAC